MVIRSKKYKIVKIPGDNVQVINLEPIIDTEELIKNYKELIEKKDNVFMCQGEFQPEKCGVKYCAILEEIDNEVFVVTPPCTHDQVYLFRRMLQLKCIGADWESFYQRCFEGSWEVQRVLLKG